MSNVQTKGKINVIRLADREFTIIKKAFPPPPPPPPPKEKK